MKYLNLSSSGSKLESVTCKFTKNRSPSQLLFKEFHYKCRTAILKNVSWWLLLRTTSFWKYLWMAAFQRQLQSIFILKNSRLHIFYISYFDVMLKRNEFFWIFLSKGFEEKCKQTKLALSFIQNSILGKKHVFPLI